MSKRFPCLFCSPLLSCAVPRRAVLVSVPVRLLVLCITVTFRLSVRVSFPVCCGWYVCFSKPLTFHNGFMFFLLLVAVSSTFRDNKPYLICEIGRACCLEKCLKQLREAKNMKPLWKVKGFEKPATWKESVPDFVFLGK